MLLWPLYSVAIIMPWTVKRSKMFYETNENNYGGEKKKKSFQEHKLFFRYERKQKNLVPGLLLLHHI